MERRGEFQLTAVHHWAVLPPQYPLTPISEAMVSCAQHGHEGNKHLPVKHLRGDSQNKTKGKSRHLSPLDITPTGLYISSLGRLVVFRSHSNGFVTPDDLEHCDLLYSPFGAGDGGLFTHGGASLTLGFVMKPRWGLGASPSGL